MCRKVIGDDFKNLVPTPAVGVIPVARPPSGNQHQSRVRTRSVRQGQRAGQLHRSSRKLHGQVLERPKILSQSNTKNGNHPQIRKSQSHALVSTPIYSARAVAERPELRHAGPNDVNREAELRAPSRVACSDLLDHMVIIISFSLSQEHTNNPILDGCEDRWNREESNAWTIVQRSRRNARAPCARK
jgi:hypothetical protein